MSFALIVVGNIMCVSVLKIICLSLLISLVNLYKVNLFAEYKKNLSVYLTVIRLVYHTLKSYFFSFHNILFLSSDNFGTSMEFNKNLLQTLQIHDDSNDFLL